MAGQPGLFDLLDPYAALSAPGDRLSGPQPSGAARGRHTSRTALAKWIPNLPDF